MPVDEFAEYRDYLMILARSQIAIDLRGRIDPSDLVQDTLCDALRDRPQSRTRAETMGWLRSVLKFNLIDRLRRLRLERQVVSLDGSLDQTSVGMSRLPQGQLSKSAPSARVVREENALTLAAMLGQLSPAQAEAIVLKHCQGMSVVEIGRHMNKSPDAIGGLLRHGISRLRELMPRED